MESESAVRLVCIKGYRLVNTSLNFQFASSHFFRVRCLLPKQLAFPIPRLASFHNQVLAFLASLANILLMKRHFRADIEQGTLGSDWIDESSETWWFSAHMHVEWDVQWVEDERVESQEMERNLDEIVIDDDED